MTTFAHIGGGIAVAATVQHFVLHEEVTPMIIVAGALLGVLPDLDSLLGFLLGSWTPGTEMLNHHRYFTHTPLFYLILTGLVWLARGWKWAALFGAVTLTHLLFDSWSTDDGIMWLWPLQDSQHALFSMDVHAGGLHGLQFYSRYVRTPRLILPELMLVAGGVFVIIRYLLGR